MSPCIHIDLGDGTFAHAIVRVSKQEVCGFCHARLHSKLCDYPTGKGKTCDRKMCDRCATSVGEDLDYCPTHQHARPNQAQLPFGS